MPQKRPGRGANFIEKIRTINMHIAIPKEITADEQRVAIVPSLIKELTQIGCRVLMQRGAGVNADYPDESYLEVQFFEDVSSLYQRADLILKVQPPTIEEVALFKKNSLLISFLFPNRYPERIAALGNHHITSFAIDLLPRITRAQAMDALSSQATVSGYKATLIAANNAKCFFPMLTTAAGTIRPTNVLIIGAGVAGLQAIATARRLGAVVKAYDIRSSAKEQVESLGAKMIDIGITADAAGGYARELSQEEQGLQQKALAYAFTKAEIVISTALIPGKPAPKIITRDMVESMMPGSLIIDIAAEAGGNCELTQPGETIKHHHVTILGPLNLPSMLAHDASMMYAKNLCNFVKLLVNNGRLDIDWQDEIIADTVTTKAPLPIIAPSLDNVF
jgi:proton-translocating NAD(P)+ transhydrogenase subunit alpha